MADDADIAAVRVEAAIGDAIARHLARPRSTGRLTCRVCGGLIPADRRAVLPGVSACVDCARREEREASPCRRS
ncbi:TraR/DksA C4-type zinc finger protein [Tistrella bauzanensis]|uniref:TraR/DksA C4-type zinc finger protein n=1 Tax=Tistrella TaxID=171436 RepID=UPI0031F68765